MESSTMVFKFFIFVLLVSLASSSSSSSNITDCPNVSPYPQITVTPSSNHGGEVYVNVTVSGILNPSEGDWVGMIAASHTVKAMHMSDDPDYLSCNKHECKNECMVRTCSGTLTFHVINIRTDIKFVLYYGGFKTPCILGRSSGPFNFANPKKLM